MRAFDSPDNRKPFPVQVDRVTNVLLLEIGREVEREVNEWHVLRILEVYGRLEDINFTAERESGVLRTFARVPCTILLHLVSDYLRRV